MIEPSLPDEELTRQAMEILNREMGTANTLRFIRQLTHGMGDYTADRHRWLGHLTLDQILAEIKKRPPTSG